MRQSGETRNYNVGKSDYAKHKIQPWDIWKEYNLNPWDADIVKRALRTKEGEERSSDYQKIIHICKERIRQLAEEAKAAPECKPKTECEDKKRHLNVNPKTECEDEEDDNGYDVRVRCEKHGPPMFYYPYSVGVKYGVYGVFEAYRTWYAYLGKDEAGCNVYLRLSKSPGSWSFTKYKGFPEYTFHVKKEVLGDRLRNYAEGYEISLKIGGYGTDYEKGDYIINNGLLYRYMGIRSILEKGVYKGTHKYIRMVGNGCFEEFFTTEKADNEVVQEVIKVL